MLRLEALWAVTIALEAEQVGTNRPISLRLVNFDEAELQHASSPLKSNVLGRAATAIQTHSAMTLSMHLRPATS